MAGRTKVKSYRDQAAMERDAAKMASRGWKLEGWRERGKGDGDSGPEPLLGTFPDPHTAHMSSAHDASTALAWLAKQVVLLPVRIVRGPQRVKAWYYRAEVGPMSPGQP